MAYRPPSRPTLGRFTTASGTFLGIAGGIASFTVANGHPAVLAITAVGLTCIPVGLAVCYGGKIIDWMKDRFPIRHIDISNCRNNEDVDAIYNLAVSKFGDVVTPPSQMLRIQGRYRDSLKVAHWVGGKKARELCGYFITFPMNKSLVDKIYYDNFKIVEINPADVPTRPRYAYATYIGGVVGIGRRARAELTGALKAELAYAAKTKSGLVFARAATEEGLRVLTRNGFSPVHKRAVGIDCFYFRNLHAELATSHAPIRQPQLKLSFS